MNKLLPIGSVVKIQESDKYAFMIVGYFPQNKEGEMRDYSAVRYPMGAYDSRVFFFINHKDISTVLFRGYENEEYSALMELISVYAKEESVSEKVEKEPNDEKVY